MLCYAMLCQVATSNAASLLGLVPVFADVEEDSLTVPHHTIP